MRIISFLTLLLCMSVVSRAQESTRADESSDVKPLCIIGVVTDNPADFPKIVDFLRTTKGITVADYCVQNNLISISFSKERFDELFSVFDYIQSHFTDAKCFDKSMSRDTYWKECGSELAKQK